jgi:DNA-binding PadR family transcriptional regulator
MSKKSLELLTETMFYVLMALNKQDMFGTEIADFIKSKTEGRIAIGPGTLYTILAKFEAENMISEVDLSGRKRTYTITGDGRGAYYAELERLRVCIADAESEEA